MSDEELERQAELYLKLKNTSFIKRRYVFEDWLTRYEEEKSKMSTSIPAPFNAIRYLGISQWRRLPYIIRRIIWKNDMEFYLIHTNYYKKLPR